ncbi:MAG: ABC transporter ATP-binding protein [bacterium]|nr:ABC transporter ATP-binding protein [bacterium]
MTQPVVNVNNLERFYEMKGETVKALNGVDLSIDRGEFMALAGPSGSGKSTMLNLIGGLDYPTTGNVVIDGRDLQELSGRELAELRRDRIGFVFQAYNLVPVLTAEENVEYVMLLQGRAKKERHERAMEILGDVGLADMADRRPTELSGGQQQRVAVARAIAAEPAIVLADEPTANLDSASGESLLDLMAELNRLRGVTFIFSTHDTMIMERASRLVSLRDGRIAGDEKR